MILIAENNYEDQVLPGLVSLLRDLRLDACGFYHADAIAPIFWSSDDFSLELASVNGLTKDDMSAVLANLEPDLIEAMILAGFEVIDNYFADADGTQIHKHHRSALRAQRKGRKKLYGGITK